VKRLGYIVKLLLRWSAITISVSVLVFVAAGGTGFPSLRRYIGTFSASLLATMLCVDPSLIEERSSYLTKATSPGRLAAGLFFLATLVLAGLDIGRLQWLDSVSSATRTSGLLLFVAAATLQLWAMAVNPFFSPEIRPQTERGHRLITQGPYRFLRHPGYLAMLISVPASALAIGSWLALIPATAFCFVVLDRVRREEEFLLQNFAGYGDYKRRVRGGLIPRPTVRRGLRRPALLVTLLALSAGGFTCARDLVPASFSSVTSVLSWYGLPKPLPGLCSVADLELHRCEWR